MEFRNQFDFLSNMYPCKITDDFGLTYSCVESAYQAAKSSDLGERRKISRMAGPAAKKAGRKLTLVDDWNSKRIDVMRSFLEQKFSNPELMGRLCFIQGDIVEDNTWNDKFWGKYKGKGENHLGLLLMEIRDKKLAEVIVGQPESEVKPAHGKIVITSIKKLVEADKNVPLTEAWFVVRSLKSLNGTLPNVGNAMSYWVHQLSPSDGLFSTYWTMKKQGAWNHETFMQVYVPQFLEEMRTDFAKNYLNTLYHSVMDDNKNVALVCFCNDEAECHRSILAGLMQGVGVEVVNECGVPVDYSLYNDMYRATPKVEQVQPAPVVQSTVADTSASMANSVPSAKPVFALLVAGSRTFHDAMTMENVLNNLLSVKAQTHDIIIVEGAARGADSLAREYAKHHGYQVKEFPAQWVVNGQRDRAAGFKRNRQMHEFLKDHTERGCVCFWDGTSPGTADNFKLCKEFGTPLRVYDFQQGTYVD